MGTTRDQRMVHFVHLEEEANKNWQEWTQNFLRWCCQHCRNQIRQTGIVFAFSLVDKREEGEARKFCANRSISENISLASLAWTPFRVQQFKH